MQELINGLLVWAVTLTGYEQPVDLPVVEAVSHQQLVKTLCKEQFCTAVAYYDTDTHIIYYDERMQLEQDQSARGFIIHEMVHYLQDLNGELVPAEMSCEQRIEKEQEAYRVQQYFLREHREPTFQIDLAVAVLANVCKTNNVVE
jgi:hypothetical protein